MTLRDFIPPIASSLKARFRSAYLTRTQRRTFGSYEEALKECTSFGYEASDLVEVVYQKTLAYRDALRSDAPPMTPSDALALFALGLLFQRSNCIRVLDFGGACGAHYFRMQSLFPSSLPLRWHVVETPAMVRRARSLQTDSLRFFDTLSEAKDSLGQIDIVYSSSALQCVPDPHPALTALIECAGTYLVLPRFGLNAAKTSLITLHETALSDNGPGKMPRGIRDGKTRYPMTFLSREAVESQINQDYEILVTVADTSCIIPIEGHKLLGLGYVGSRKINAPPR